MAQSINTAGKIEQLFTVAAEAAHDWLEAAVAADKAASKASEHLAAFITRTVDACHAAGVTKDKKGCDFVATLVTGNQPVVDAIAEGLLEAKTVTEYAQGAKRAFFHGVAWQASLKNNPAMALPFGKASKSAGTVAAAPTAGKIKSTSRADLDATACKLLAQARMLGLNDLAADILDLLIDRLDGFSEPAPAPV